MSIKPLEPGCLALIIGGRHTGLANIGKTVTCVQMIASFGTYQDKHGRYYNSEGDAWLVESTTHNLQVPYERFGVRSVKNHFRAIVAPHHLLRLGDDPDETEENSREHLHRVADKPVFP